MLFLANKMQILCVHKMNQLVEIELDTMNFVEWFEKKRTKIKIKMFSKIRNRKRLQAPTEKLRVTVQIGSLQIQSGVHFRWNCVTVHFYLRENYLYSERYADFSLVCLFQRKILRSKMCLQAAWIFFYYYVLLLLARIARTRKFYHPACWVRSLPPSFYCLNIFRFSTKIGNRKPTWHSRRCCLVNFHVKYNIIIVITRFNVTFEKIAEIES